MSAHLDVLGSLYEQMDAARAAFEQARATHGETATRWRAYDWAVRTEQEYEQDELLERAGPAAKEAIEAALGTFNAAKNRVSAAIGKLIGDGDVAIGDVFRSPWSKVPLAVVAMFAPSTPLLSEATMTEDGEPAEREFHSPQLDEAGKPIPEDVVPVRFERWSVNGLRVGGMLHPESRKVLATD